MAEEPTRTTDPEKETSAPLPEWEFKHQASIVLYEALTARVGHRDALLWQSPALALTAQAFLLVIGLGHDSAPVARFIAALLGVAVTIMSVQLMLKHRMYMTNDQVMMVALEQDMGFTTSAIDHPLQLAHLDKDQSGLELRKRAKEKWGLTIIPSVDLWLVGLGLFGVINVLLMIFAFHDALGVPCNWIIQPAEGEPRCLVRL